MRKSMEFEKLVLLGLIFCWAARVDGKPQAFYMFGDSTIDSGNNNQLVTIVKANFPPYGEDFPGGAATGRFTNGRLVTDMLSGLMGLPDELPAYLDPNFKGEQLLTGACFGSGGAGLDDSTSTPLDVITLSQQVDNFRSYKTKLASMVGEDDASKIISSALFGIIVWIHCARTIYNEGATKVMIIGLPPFGCLPSTITLHNLFNGTCVDEYNNVATYYNNNVTILLDSMKPSLPGLQLVYIDIYDRILDMIQNPNKYGFEEVRKGCCGTGDIEAGPFCNTLSIICDDVSKYLFWDSVHPTSKAYSILVGGILNQAKGIID
ncbi:hypothetical protein SUGI_0421570 [Cryptomeria japonica]|uniref:GDSL esterase/lipase At2g40250-like n=1 Tax=Cryptomeria japonica TaxID=3369 RepID=UPI002408D2B9|nr:GDSL esterase/lipase At2g40250-like [Cryptomeria japonica]GLJ22397.1 hypothetical protein SUGI_0421570 [Cryptomeria japonica]